LEYYLTSIGTPTKPFRNAELNTTDEQKQLGLSRAYTLTLSPQIIYTKSKIVEQLVSSNVYRQLEFQAVGNWWIYSADSRALKRLPNGREDIFQDNTIDNRAKRSLMKFLKFVVDYQNQREIWESHASTSLHAFLSSQFGLPLHLQTVISALTLSLDSPEGTLVEFALPRIARHLTSIGVFGPGFGAVIPKWGGAAEIAQVACRAGAVGGGVYILGTGVKSSRPVPEGDLSLEQVELSNGETVKTKFMAQDISRDDVVESKLVSKVIAVVSSPLACLFISSVEGSPVTAVSVVVFPANSLPNQTHPVYLMVHSSEAGECPPGQCKLHTFLLYYHLMHYDDQIIPILIYIV